MIDAYGRAEAVSRRMEARGERSDLCRLDRDHGQHVISDRGVKYPCGGGWTQVKAEGERD